MSLVNLFKYTKSREHRTVTGLSFTRATVQRYRHQCIVAIIRDPSDRIKCFHENYEPVSHNYPKSNTSVEV